MDNKGNRIPQEANAINMELERTLWESSEPVIVGNALYFVFNARKE